MMKLGPQPVLKKKIAFFGQNFPQNDQSYAKTENFFSTFLDL